MTAISAAIVELEAWRESLSKLIADLRRHDSAIEAAYPPLAVPGRAASFPSPKVSAGPSVAPAEERAHRAVCVGAARKMDTVPTPAAVPARPKDIVLTKPAEAARIDAAVRQALHGGPLKATVLIARAKCSASQLKTSLKRLRAQKLVSLVGATAQARWSLVSGAPLPPTTAAGPGRTLDAEAFDTVWNGRKSDASLIGDRTTRSARP